MSNEERKFDLRWSLQYRGFSRFGPWSQVPQHRSESSALQPRGGLISASIESRCLKTGEIRTAAACPFGSFIEFKAVAIARFGNLLNKGPRVPITQLAGLTLVTKAYSIRVLDTGQIQLKEVKK